MKTIPLKRVTIIGENSLEEQLVQEIHGLGATGYTYTVVHGDGKLGRKPSTWSGPNAKIEVIATPEVADRILEHLSKNYFQAHGVIAFIDNVEVVRGEKFGAA